MHGTFYMCINVEPSSNTMSRAGCFTTRTTIYIMWRDVSGHDVTNISNAHGNVDAFPRTSSTSSMFYLTVHRSCHRSPAFHSGRVNCVLTHQIFCTSLEIPLEKIILELSQYHAQIQKHRTTSCSEFVHVFAYIFYTNVYFWHQFHLSRRLLLEYSNIIWDDWEVI